MIIKILATGGTFDKIYFDAKSEFHIGEPMATSILEEANVDFEFEVESILEKDSLEINDQDRQHIRQKVVEQDSDKIIITHGTDAMVETGRFLENIPGKTIVITGAMQPARMRYSDAGFNIGFAYSAVQILPPSVYIAMNGKIFDPQTTRKNVALSRFETIASSTFSDN
ncbi:MAG: asparaginase [Gammaproteobacteria bacterium]|nr:asparaginase [Gammaproteobacteria bacterium]